MAVAAVLAGHGNTMPGPRERSGANGYTGDGKSLKDSDYGLGSHSEGRKRKEMKKKRDIAE